MRSGRGTVLRGQIASVLAAPSSRSSTEQKILTGVECGCVAGKVGECLASLKPGCCDLTLGRRGRGCCVAEERR